MYYSYILSLNHGEHSHSKQLRIKMLALGDSPEFEYFPPGSILAFELRNQIGNYVDDSLQMSGIMIDVNCLFVGIMYSTMLHNIFNGMNSTNSNLRRITTRNIRISSSTLLIITSNDIVLSHDNIFHSYNLPHKTYITYSLTTNQSNILICYKLDQIISYIGGSM